MLVMFSCAAGSLSSWTAEKNGTPSRGSHVGDENRYNDEEMLSFHFLTKKTVCLKLKFIYLILSSSVASSTAAPLQIKDLDSDWERQKEIYYKFTSAKQTENISES